MRIERSIVVLRHNAQLAGDLRLAIREFEALVGEPGQLLAGQRDIVAALGGSRAAYVPKLSSNPRFVGILWTEAPISGLTRLLRRSAFAQELLIQDTSASRLQAFRIANPAITADTSEFNGTILVALAWNYLIESEGILDDPRREGRVQRTLDLLLAPYLHGESPRASLKLRLAKKTTLSLSHDLHIYKAKFFPRMVRALLNIFATAPGPIFDAFCGSGTALLEASLLGMDSAGVDIDPICQLISRTKVEPFLNPTDLLTELAEFEAALLNPKAETAKFLFPTELAAKILRRDRIDGTDYLPEIMHESAAVAAALNTVQRRSVNRELLAVLASDAVTKKVRYRFVGVGNGKYTIEIVKQPLIERISEKLERCRQLAFVFRELRDVLGLKLGRVDVTAGDARDPKSWPLSQDVGAIITSPPYLPASSGREHYAASRALAFAVLGFNPGAHGYYDVSSPVVNEPESLSGCPEATQLLRYLASDESDSADPQRDAMRFLRKAIPTRQYLDDMARFLRSARAVLNPEGLMILVIAQQHTFYSHRRQEIEHVVSGVDLYSQIAAAAGLGLNEEIAMELLKSAASRARPRAKDDYYESVLILRKDRPITVQQTIQPFDPIIRPGTALSSTVTHCAGDGMGDGL
jgi:hypothetical protein